MTLWAREQPVSYMEAVKITSSAIALHMFAVCGLPPRKRTNAHGKTFFDRQTRPCTSLKIARAEKITQLLPSSHVSAMVPVVDA